MNLTTSHWVMAAIGLVVGVILGAIVMAYGGQGKTQFPPPSPPWVEPPEITIPPELLLSPTPFPSPDYDCIMPYDYTECMACNNDDASYCAAMASPSPALVP